MWDIFNMVYALQMHSFHSMYNTIHSSRHENVLLDNYFLYLYEPSDWLWQYFVISHNSITHIFSVVVHDVDM